MEATARISSKCAACQADSPLVIRQYVHEGRLSWMETFACGCGHGFEAREVGLPSPAARRALLEQHGASELWLDKQGGGEATVKVLVMFLGVAADEVKAKLRRLPVKVYEGTRVEAEFVAEALERVFAGVRVVPKLPAGARREQLSSADPAAGPSPPGASGAAPGARARSVHVTKENAQVVLRQAIKELKTDVDRGAAIAQKVLDVARKAGTFARLHASFEVFVHLLVRRKSNLDVALTVARELMSLQRDRTHLALLSDVLKALGRAEEAARAADEAGETKEEHGEVQRDFLKTCAALGVDPTQ